MPASQNIISTEGQLFSKIEPFDSGYLQVSPLHNVYYEQCGNPHGVPILFLHGGPGSGCTPKQRQFFDPDYYRVILFDQRGCGRSNPLGCITENTTWDLIEDIEKLRMKLNIERWFILGGSWGSTLALAYTTHYYSRVNGLILRGIFLARQSELDWFLCRTDYFFPEAYAQFISPLSPSELDNILSAYQQRIFSEDPLINLPAAKTWNTYEASIMSLLPAPVPAEPVPPTPDEILLARARVQLHYLINDCFLQQYPLMQEVAQFRKLPCIIIQGRYDMVCPPATSYALHQTWPESQFIMVPDAGHSAMEPGISSALVEATEFFKRIIH